MNTNTDDLAKMKCRECGEIGTESEVYDNHCYACEKDGTFPAEMPSRDGAELGGLPVRPVGFPPHVWGALMEIRLAQGRLEDDFPNWDEAGQKYAVRSAAVALRRAHQEIMHFVSEVRDATR